MRSKKDMQLKMLFYVGDNHTLSQYVDVEYC